jgi:hypothetical protein
MQDARPRGAPIPHHRLALATMYCVNIQAAYAERISQRITRQAARNMASRSQRSVLANSTVRSVIDVPPVRIACERTRYAGE